MTKTAPRLPPINAVRVFEAAARHESFTRAAAELGMTQAAVSYQIKLLEERLGFLLFRRQPRGVDLTDAGRRLSRATSEAFDILRAAFMETAEDAGQLLTISAIPTFSSHWLAPRIGAFQVAHSEIAVRLDTSPRLVDLTREDIDVGVRMGDGSWPGLTAHFLMSHDTAPLVPAATHARFGPFKDPRDLLKLRLIGSVRWWRRWFTAAGAGDVDLPTHTPMEFETQFMEIAAAMSVGDAAAIVAPVFFKPEIAAGTLVQPFEATVRGQGIWLVHDARRARSPKIAAFVRWILSEIESDAAAKAFNPPRQGLSTPA